MRNNQRAFTLVEMIVVITILGIIGAAVAVFIKRPVQGYVDLARRAELTDIADTALRRVGRDLRLALPNSIRVSTVGATVYVEMLETRTGGRYRADLDASNNGDILDFSQSDGSFDSLGPMSALPGQVVAANDLLVVYNLGIPGADAYRGDNSAVITGTASGDLANETKINFAPRQFVFASPGNRYQVVSGAVTYECTRGALDAQGNATGTLRRVWNYTISPNQPTGSYPNACPTCMALLAQNVADCDIQYDPLVVNQRNGLVTIWLRLTQRNESVSLYHEVHVSNVP